MNRAVPSPARAVTETAWRFAPGRCILRPPMNAPSDGAGAGARGRARRMAGRNGDGRPPGRVRARPGRPAPGCGMARGTRKALGRARGAAGRFRHSEPRPQGIRSLR